MTQNGIYVRAGAASTTINGSQNTSAQGTVIGGPTTATLNGTSYVWWNVNFDSGADGWIAGNYLAEIASLPDFIISSISVNPTSGQANSTATVYLTVKNQGAGAGANSLCRIRLASSTTITGSDPLLSEFTVGVLNAGQSATFSKTVTIPPGTTAGARYMGATANANSAVTESASGQNNNQNTTPFSVTAVAQLPDFIISSISVNPTSGQASSTATVYLTVKNQGAGPGANSLCRIRLASSTTITGSDPLLSEFTIGALNAGQSATFSKTVTIPPGTSAGSRYIGATANADSAVTESASGLNNNQNTTPFAVTAVVGLPDFIVSAISVNPSSGAAGSTATVSVTVKNQGAGSGAISLCRIRLASSTTITGSDPLLDSFTVGALSAGQSLSFTRPVTIPPGTSAGSRYMGATANADSAVTESASGLNNNQNTTPFTVAQGEGGDLGVSLKDAYGSNAPVVANSTPRFVLYTNPSVEKKGYNPYTFTNVTAGTYWVEAFHTGTFWGEEFWNSEQKQVGPNQTNSLVLTRKYPYAFDVTMRDAATNAVIQRGASVAAGTTVNFTVSVRNDVPSASLSAQVRFRLDYSRDGTYDYDSGWSTGQQIASGGGTRPFTFPVTLTASNSGQLYFSLGVQTTTTPGVKLTDSWGWTEACRVTPVSMLRGDAKRGSFTTPVVITLHGSGQIDPTKRTWVIVHGRNDTALRPVGTAVEDFWATQMAAAILSNFEPGNDQVLFLDWKDGADSLLPWSFDNELWIEPVAVAAQQLLYNYGFRGEDLYLIGHSWGAYVCEGIGERMPLRPGTTLKSVHSLVALDPAKDYWFNILDFDPEDSVNFQNSALRSWAFRTSTLGSPVTSITADEAIAVNTRQTILTDPFGTVSHSAAKDIFTHMLNNPNNGISQHFRVERLIAGALGPWMPNQYYHQLLPSEFVRVQYEAYMFTTSDGMRPQQLNFVSASTGLPITEYAITDTTPLFTISGSSGFGGNISPEAPQIVRSGQSATFTAAPLDGYVVDKWLLSGSAVQTGGSSYTVINITSNKTVQVTFKSGSTPQVGSLTTTILPAGAASAGAQWQINGGTWQNTGATLGGLSSGSHTLSFKSTNGWTAPTSQTVIVVTNQTSSASGTYVLVPTTGSLTVSISPSTAVSAGAQWQVDGGAWQSSGAIATGLSTGSHTVAFKTVSGYATPGSQTATITANQTTTLSGAYVAVPQTGALTVNLGPAGAVSAGAQWRVDGGNFQNSGATVSGLSTGSHTVAFKSVSGWTAPSSQTVTVSANQTTTASGTYVSTAQTGSLQVTITPSGAVGSGAQWQVDGGTWRSSGATASSLSTGTHTVSFSTVSGYTKPASQTVTVSANQTATATGVYVASQTGSLQVTITPAGAVSAGAQWQVDGGAWLNSGSTSSGLSAGTHTVSFKPVAGWTMPGSQTATVVVNQTAPVTGAYSQTGTPNGLFSDDFNDNSINPAKWTKSGNSVTEAGQTMQVLTTVTDAGGNLSSAAFPVSQTGVITITRKVFVHYANSYFGGLMRVEISGLPKFGIHYENYAYSGPYDVTRYGFFITRNNANSHGVAGQSDTSATIPAVWDTWFNEKLTYNPATGELEYFINHASKLKYNVGILPQSASHTMTLSFNAWGWWTGHQHLFDDILVAQAGIPSVITDSAKVGTQQVGNTSYLTFSYRQMIGASNLGYTVGVSDDLVTWDWTEGQIEHVGTPVATGDGVTEEVTVRLAAPMNTLPARKFMKLKVTQSP